MTYEKACRTLTELVVTEGTKKFKTTPVLFTVLLDWARKMNASKWMVDAATPERLVSIEGMTPWTEGGWGFLAFGNRLKTRLITLQRRGDARFDMYQPKGKGSPWMVRFTGYDPSFIKSCPACKEMKALGLEYEETHSSLRLGFLTVNDKEVADPHFTIYCEGCGKKMNMGAAVSYRANADAALVYLCKKCYSLGREY